MSSVDWGSLVGRRLLRAGISESVINEVLAFAHKAFEEEECAGNALLGELGVQKGLSEHHPDIAKRIGEYRTAYSSDRESATRIYKEIEELLDSNRGVEMVMVLLILKLYKRVASKCELLGKQFEIVSEMENVHLRPVKYGLKPSEKLVGDLNDKLNELTAIMGATAYIIRGIQTHRMGHPR